MMLLIMNVLMLLFMLQGGILDHARVYITDKNRDTDQKKDEKSKKSATAEGEQDMELNLNIPPTAQKLKGQFETPAKTVEDENQECGPELEDKEDAPEGGDKEGGPEDADKEDEPENLDKEGSSNIVVEEAKQG